MGPPLRSCVLPDSMGPVCDMLSQCLAACARGRGEKLHSVSRHGLYFWDTAIAVLRRCNFDGRLDFPGTFSKKSLLIQGA